MTLVTPTMTEMSIALGILKRVIPKTAEDADDEGVEDLPADEAAEHPVGLGGQVKQPVGALLAEGWRTKPFLQPAQNRSLSSSM